jgi:hypothetical protein
VTVWGFATAPTGPVCDQSPFVARVECFLRLHGIPYIKNATKGLRENPHRQKMPVANVKGTMVDDSQRIIDTIKQKFSIVDATLSPNDRAMTFTIRQLLFQSFYFVSLYNAFATEEGVAARRAVFIRQFGRILGEMILVIEYIVFMSISRDHS